MKDGFVNGIDCLHKTHDSDLILNPAWKQIWEQISSAMGLAELEAWKMIRVHILKTH